jgi:sigma-E factor negative regulatory protein RseC
MARFGSYPGRVLSISGDRITVKRGVADCCSGCKTRNCGGDTGLFIAENRTGLPLRPGLLVETEFRPGSAIAEGAALLLPPGLGFIAGFLVSGLIFPDLADAPRAFLGLIVLFGTAFVLFLVRRRFPSRTLPRIARILD